MKTLEYYTSGQHLDQLTERFGGQLELLNRSRKLQLRVLLTYYLLGKDSVGDEYSLEDGFFDSLEQTFCPDSEIEEAVKLLQGISVQDAESLLTALQAQCTLGNARLKTATETMTDSLTQHGVPHAIARQAAYVLVTVDNGTQPRTPDQQAVIDQVHQIITGAQH